MQKILLVEDNPHIMKINCDTLQEAGYETAEARNISEARKVLGSGDIQLIIMDIMLPDGDGVQFCGEIKKEWPVPVLFLSAKNENSDIVNGLRAGGDDYLTKPYDLEIMVARVGALLRRSTAGAAGERIVCSGISFDVLSMHVRIGNSELALSHSEFSVLLILAQHAGNLVRKEDLYEKVWHQRIEDDSGALYKTMSRLKKQLEGQEQFAELETVKNAGYILNIVKN